jgi:hypothetical protein
MHNLHGQHESRSCCAGRKTISETRHVELPLDHIELDPENVRSEYDPAIVEGLRRALTSEGRYINPPIVYQVAPGHYRVKHGNTRVLAARGVVDCLLVSVQEPPASDSTKLLSQMGENLLQGSLRPADVGAALKRLRQADGRERSLSQVVGALKAAGLERTKSWVSMHLALAELAPEVQRLLNQGSLVAEAAYQLRNLSAAEQVQWAHRIVDEGLSVAQVRRLLGDQPPTPMDIEEALAEAADAAAVEPPRPRRQADAEHRDSRPVTRFELLPVDLGEHGSSQLGLDPQSVERGLAHEAIVLGNRPPEAASKLARDAMAELNAADDAVLLALNVLRQLIEQPQRLPSGALADYLALRARWLLTDLNR